MFRKSEQAERLNTRSPGSRTAGEEDMRGLPINPLGVFASPAAARLSPDPTAL